MTTPPRALEGALTAAGTGLVGAAIMLSTEASRDRHHLDGSTYALGLLGMAGLLLVSAAAYLLVREPVRRAVLSSYPGAVGALGVGGMLVAGADAHGWSQWLAGPLVAAIAAVGIVAVRTVPYVVAAAIGLAELAVKLTTHILAERSHDHISHLSMWLSLAIWLFVAFATALSWFLPGRNTVAVWLGACGLVANVVALAAIFIVGSIIGAFAGALGGKPRSTTWAIGTTDVAVTLVLVGAAVAGWTVLYLLSGVAGYRVLIVVACTAMPAVGATVLSVSHPSVWELVLGILGGGVLLAVVGAAIASGRRPQPAED